MNKIKYIPFLILLLISFNSLAQPECSRYKIGKYVLTDPSINYEMVVERNDSIQIERNMITGTESKYWVKWKNDCEYSLKIFKGPKDEMEFYKDKLLYVKIVETEKNNYTFIASIQGQDFSITQKMYVLPSSL